MPYSIYFSSNCRTYDLYIETGIKRFSKAKNKLECLAFSYCRNEGDSAVGIVNKMGRNELIKKEEYHIQKINGKIEFELLHKYQRKWNSLNLFYSFFGNNPRT